MDELLSEDELDEPGELDDPFAFASLIFSIAARLEALASAFLVAARANFWQRSAQVRRRIENAIPFVRKRSQSFLIDPRCNFIFSGSLVR